MKRIICCSHSINAVKTFKIFSIDNFVILLFDTIKKKLMIIYRFSGSAVLMCFLLLPLFDKILLLALFPSFLDTRKGKIMVNLHYPEGWYWVMSDGKWKREEKTVKRGLVLNSHCLKKGEMGALKWHGDHCNDERCAAEALWEITTLKDMGSHTHHQQPLCLSSFENSLLKILMSLP